MISNQFIVSFLLLAFLGGCSSNGKPPIRYYVLEPIAQEALAENERTISIQIIDLHIPQYLERFQMVMRSGSNELVFSDSHQWGENIRKNLLRVLSINLSTILGTPEVSTPLTRSKLNADVKVKVFIERFDQSENGQIILNARYQLTRNPTRNLIRNNAQDKVQSDLHETSVPRTYAFNSEQYNPAERNYSSMVANMGQLFNELSIAISRHLIEMENQ